MIDNLLSCSVVFLFSLIIFYFFLRFTFDVEKNLKYKEKQIRLLMKIAEKQGVSKEEIKEAVKF